MEIRLQDIEKKYGKERVFTGLCFSFFMGNHYLISGFNGSGKSTLLRIISGAEKGREGTVEYTLDGKQIPYEEMYRYVSITTPFSKLIEEFTISELFDFYSKFKKIKSGYGSKELMALARLEDSKNKPIQNFSSGMKQRLKLALAFITDVPILLFDEPCSNLDKFGEQWYTDRIAEFKNDHLIIVASNQVETEAFFCEETLDITAFKEKKK
jgi:ABC-type multidrug transport system ATPase subunit